ncbi:MAG: hypothetical protein PHX62_02355 [Bacilli bacterium]|nr:hypothetical protein [Bacilli bacterium]
MTLIDIIILGSVSVLFVLIFYRYFIKNKGTECSSCSKINKYNKNNLKAYYDKVKNRD